MSKLIRRTKKKFGAALLIALQIITLTLAGLLMPFAGGPRPNKAPADTQVSAPQAQTQTDQAQTDTAQPITAKDLTAAEKSALRKSAHFAKKLYEPLASQVFSLQRSLVESQAAQRSSQGPESPNSEPTLTTDRDDYPPYSYVYFHGSGFEPGETVQMIVVETDPVQQSFEPWTVVAYENGNFDTSWYIFSQDFIGATFQATATGESSQLTASCTFTDAGAPQLVVPGWATVGSTVTFQALIQNINHTVGSIRFNTPPQPNLTILSGSVTATSNNSTWGAGIVGGGGTTITFEASVNNAVPQNGWVRMSITATIGSANQANWKGETWSNNNETTNNDSSNNVGLVTQPLARHYTARFVQAAATLAVASSAGA